MYKKLETERDDAAPAGQTPETECSCVCGQPAATAAEPAPEANTLAVHLADYYIKNGEPDQGAAGTPSK